ncbi:hypothetical protein EVAR_4437_1 [Eumeta japonica]|uniref:Uncharacterized protein n=1 Tax=Eumeta variegata TaxID=151549 RepID=A0A4C1SYG9_EUMVA|nr:hypothetical protein EVAR_4437_1 [Eumeta japonica]
MGNGAISKKKTRPSASRTRAPRVPYKHVVHFGDSTYRKRSEMTGRFRISLSIEKRLFQQISASPPPYSSGSNEPGFLLNRNPGNGGQSRLVTMA